MKWAPLPKEMGIADSLIRFSVGIEEFDDLRLDLEELNLAQIDRF